MPAARRVLIRIVLPALALLLHYGFVRYSIAVNANQEHRGDTGLGLAVHLGFMCIGLAVGYVRDLIRQLRRRDRALVYTDLGVLAALLLPFGWVGCNWFGFANSVVCWLPVNAFGALVGALGL